jgi:uncharacterized membrane protein
MHTYFCISMSLCMHCTKNNLKLITNQQCHIMSCKIYKFVLNDTLHQTLTKSHALGYFRFASIYVHWNVTTLTLMAKSFSIWLNTLFEWVLHPTPMTKHIYSDLECGFLKCQDHLFSSSVQSMIMVRPVEGVWLIGHGVSCELISCLLMGEHLMISLVNLLVFIALGNF